MLSCLASQSRKELRTGVELGLATAGGTPYPGLILGERCASCRPPDSPELLLDLLCSCRWSAPRERGAWLRMGEAAVWNVLIKAVAHGAPECRRLQLNY